MQRRGHLSEEQWGELLLGRGPADAAAHAAECAACGGEEQRLRTALAGYGATVRSAAERPEGFWAWQRGAIEGQLAGRRTAWRRQVWAASLALVLLIASALVRQTPPAPPAALADPDEVLINALAQFNRSEVPAALAPAALLANEMSRAVEGGWKPQGNADERR